MSARMLWTPETRARLEPPFPSPPAAYAGPPPWKTIRDALSKKRDAIAAGVPQATPELQPLMKAVLASIDDDAPPATLDLDVEAVRAALLSMESDHVRTRTHAMEPIANTESMRVTPSEKVAEALLELWVTRAGLSFAVAATVRAAALEPIDGQDEWWLMARTAPKQYFDYSGTLTPIWRGLRRRICAAHEGDRVAAESLAATIRESADGITRCALAYAFPSRPDFAAQDAREAYDRVLDVGGRMHWLMASLRDAEVAQKLIGRWSAFAFGNRSLDIVENFGEAALALFKDHIRRESALSVDAARLLYEAIAVIDTDEAFLLLAERLDVKEAAPAATTAFAQSPARAIRILSGLPRSRRIDATLAPLMGTNQQLVDAAEDELPDILVRPPWKQKSTQVPVAVIEGLVMPDIPDRMEWTVGQRDAWISSGFSYSGEDRPRTAESDARLLSESAQRLKAGGQGMWLLAYLTDAAALKLWRESPVTTWFDRKNAFNLTKLLGRWELDALPPLFDIAAADPSIGAQVFQPVCSLRVAPLMAEAFGRLKSVRAMAAAWLERFPREAATALIPIAVGPVGKARTWAENALRHLAARGQADTVRAIAKNYGTNVLEAVDAALAQDPMSQFPARLPKMPAFWKPAALPRPLLRGREKALPVSAVEALGTMLAISRIDEPYAGLALVREACDPASLADFAWALFQAFEGAGVPAKEWWAFEALGHLGDDSVARRITPILRDWPSEGGLARATQGLDVLARIGTDVALMNLHGISQRVRSKPLLLRANEKMQEIAEARGLSIDELADRLVPDLGLDESGSRVLDFGPRQFHVGFDELLRPFVKDADGQRIKDLPKPAKADNANKAAEAAALWKGLKADARKVADVQRSRLELAMCRRRRWSDSEFRTLLAGHPLLIHLVRRLVWAIYDEQDHAVATFRVAEDGSFAGPDDEVFELSAARVGIVHPLDLIPESIATWAKLFGDYLILQPFPQLGRPVYARANEVLSQTVSGTVDGLTVSYGQVLALESRGWRRGLSSNGGAIVSMVKPLPNEGYEAHLPLTPGLNALSLVESGQQTLGAVPLQKTGTWDAASRLTIGELDAITYSELEADLQSLRA